MQYLDKDLTESERRKKNKDADTEMWLAAQFELYASAEAAAKQWVFEAKGGGDSVRYKLPLTFQFSVGESATIQVLDPWCIHVIGALYPAPDR